MSVVGQFMTTSPEQWSYEPAELDLKGGIVCMGQGPCGEQSVSRPTRFARLPYVFGPSVTPLAERRKRLRRQGLTLRVTRH
jgi:hypothetical protein